MSLRRLPILVLILGFCVLPAKAQMRHHAFSISGNIRDAADHRALENIQVNLKKPMGGTISTEYSSSNGDFQFDGLQRGDYSIDIEVKDYEAVHQSVTISTNNEIGISINLVRTAKVVVPTAQLSISAHQLSVPHKAHDEYEKGMALIYVKMDYRGAIAQFQLAIKDFPNYYEAYADEGAAYFQLQEMGPSEEATRKSIEISQGQYADALFNLAELLTDTNRYAEAETISRKAIAVDKSSWRGPFELARALTRLNQPDEAEKNAQQSRDMMPDNAPVYLLLGNVHIQKKNYPALVQDLDEYLRLAPSSPEAEQARKTRDQVQAALNAAKERAAARAKENSDDDEDVDDDAPDTEQTNSPAAGPDTSGLPSLPPPTRGAN
ncbi:MAG TPA: carboxypeptidase regulatory-like domain-containing protein [Candidatus Acidoferrales bacterium]|jgi:Tfp pilus assembly protein PilF